MIKLNSEPVRFDRFPDGTIKPDLSGHDLMYEDYLIDWYYENDGEFMLLAFLKMHLDDNIDTCKATKRLGLFYVPNARLDRKNGEDEVFTLKYFAKLINSLAFDEVMVFDPHSRVSEALFNNISVISPKDVIEDVIEDIAEKNSLDVNDVVLFFPDEGAQKRYIDESFKKFVAFFGNKKRDWRTGDIIEHKIETHTDKSLDHLNGKTVLIIDDIICAGGTILHSLKELEKCGVSKAYTYCSHLENTMFEREVNELRSLLEDDGSVFKGIYTTNSIYRGDHDKVMVYDMEDIAY